MPNVPLAAVNSAIDASTIGDEKKTELKTELAARALIVPDNWIYRIVVLALGLAIFIPLAGLLAGKDAASMKELGQLLLPIATAALGALAGLLVPSPAGGNG